MAPSDPPLVEWHAGGGGHQRTAPAGQVAIHRSRWAGADLSRLCGDPRSRFTSTKQATSSWSRPPAPKPAGGLAERATGLRQHPLREPHRVGSGSDPVTLACPEDLTGADLVGSCRVPGGLAREGRAAHAGESAGVGSLQSWTDSARSPCDSPPPPLPLTDPPAAQQRDAQCRGRLGRRLFGGGSALAWIEAHPGGSSHLLTVDSRAHRSLQKTCGRRSWTEVSRWQPLSEAPGALSRGCGCSSRLGPG